MDLLGEGHEIYVSDYVAKEFSKKAYQKWPDKAEDLLRIFYGLPVYFCESSGKMQGRIRDKKDIPVLSDASHHKMDVILTGGKDFLEAGLEKPVIFSISMLDEFLAKEKGKYSLF